ncbi:MAG: LuxR C-terminal-related transcriptional regulator, partial [Verrucomicrobiota bacterium]
NHRQYGQGLRALGTREWSCWLEAGGQGWHVPLGTSGAEVAARRARQWGAELESVGWARLGRRVPREFTLSIAWFESPHACTYSTLFTLPREGTPFPGPTPAGAPVSGRGLGLAVIEPDPVFRAALAFWLGRTPGVDCAALESREAWEQQPRRRAQVDVLLVNRHSPAFTGGIRWAQASTAAVLGYGLYPTSDHIFAAISGVDPGYFLRRRPADRLLEPLAGAMARGHLVGAEVGRAVRRYFQGLLQGESDDPAGGQVGLTARERQVLGSLQRGLHDKEIATELGISPLTVHTHLKHIFEKLGAHTRTEAVMKYLEK